MKTILIAGAAFASAVVLATGAFALEGQDDITIITPGDGGPKDGDGLCYCWCDPEVNAGPMYWQCDSDCSGDQNKAGQICSVDGKQKSTATDAEKMVEEAQSGKDAKPSKHDKCSDDKSSKKTRACKGKR